jgi:predicted TIM-barrel fold metal-dependent hydrolase
MIIDSHAHLKHGDIARTVIPPETIIKTMDAVGIDKSVAFAICTTTENSIKMALNAVNQFPDRLIPYVYALPSYEKPVLSEIENAIRNLGFRGIKIHISECTLTEYVGDSLLELAGKYNVPCLIDFVGDFQQARRIATKFKETKIILAHMGKCHCTDRDLIDKFIELAENNSNVFIDTSCIALLWKLEVVIRKIGSERVLFGTDGPAVFWPDEITYARLELNKIKSLDLTEKDANNILGGNIAKLLGIAPNDNA